MARYFLTQSLLSSWQWSLKDNPYETAADGDSPTKYDDFMRTLNREPSVPNEAMQKGIDLENLVTQITLGNPNPAHKWHEAAASIAATIQGAVLQFHGKREAEVNGMKLLLHGKYDALKAGVIYDIKYSGKYETGKMFDSPQHPMYLEIEQEATDFIYLVSNGSSVWQEHYTREETPSIIPTIANFLEFLKTCGLMPLYKEKWAVQ